MIKKKEKKDTYLSRRINGILFAIFLLFCVLVFQLGDMQLINSDQYQKDLLSQEKTIVNKPVPRGKIFDANGNIIVDNQQARIITYTRGKSTTNDEMLTLAKQLSSDIQMDTRKLTDRDKKDYWITTHPDKAKEKISKDELKKLQTEKKTSDQIETLRASRITSDELKELNDKDLQIAMIFKQMRGGYKLTPQIIKSKDVSEAEYSTISEHLDQLPGVDTTSDWSRIYPNNDTLRTILGSVSDDNEGLPSDNLNYYLARDYTRNDRVGKSYIEQQYEDILHGKETRYRQNVDKNGNVTGSTMDFAGEQGKDIYLSFNIKLQKAVEDSITKQLLAAKGQPGTALMDRALVVMMDPKTGQVLSMAGKKFNTKADGTTELQDFALGTITTSYPMGSVVKGATILSGYKWGATQPYKTFKDEPLYIQGTPPKKSWKTFDELDDLRALTVSSNVYMFKTIIAMGHGEYVAHKPLHLDSDIFEKVRKDFSEFGLGVPTEIDLPNETAGLKGAVRDPGNAIDLGIGQFDNYTTLQLAQYVSTIANGGYRMKPQILSSIQDPPTKDDPSKKIIETIKPTVLNRIDSKITDDQIKRVQLGFWNVMHNPEGTGVAFFGNAPYVTAGKTGTAQIKYQGVDVVNKTMVGYAPFDNPQIAFAVVVPWMDNVSPPVNGLIARDITDAYFALKN